MHKLILLGMILALALGVAGPARAQTAPTLALNPTSGSGGTRVSYAGTGFTPGGVVTVVMSADGLIVDDTVADATGAISGSFTAPDRADITGEASDTIPVFALDAARGTESNRVPFTYVQPHLPGTGSSAGAAGRGVAVLALLILGGAMVRRQALLPRG